MFAAYKIHFTALSSHSCFSAFHLCPKDPEPHPTGPTLAPAASRFITSRLEVDAAPARGIGDALARVPGRQLGEVDKSLRAPAQASVAPRVPPLTTLARLVTPIPTDTGSRCGSGSESGAGACASASTPEGPGPSCSGARVVPWPGVNPTAAATAAQDRHAVNDARAGAVPHGRGLKLPRGATATATVQLEGTNADVNLKSMLIDTRFSPATGSDGEQHASDMLSSSLQPALPTSGCT